ncbi:putative PLAC8 motif-containing protein [Helianthus anomalus]
MATAWEHLGEIANVAQLSGIDAVRLIGMIIQAASTARLHKNNCKQFAMHLRLIGNLLDQLKISELKKYPETREPLEQLEDALRRSYILVNSCQVRSYLYLLAMGWTIVYQFRKAQDEIDRYLKIIPLISLVNNARVRERLEYIEMDRHEYTLDDEDRKAQEVIMNPDPFNTDVSVLRRSFSYSYPDLPFNEVIKKENEKLHLELQRSQSCLDASQSEIIQNFMQIAHVFASDHQCEDTPYYPYVSSHPEDENRNDLQIVVHSASNTQFEKAIPYYPYVSSNEEHEKSNDSQIIVHSASNSKFAKAVPYYPDVSSKQEHENSNDLQIGVCSALRSTSSTSSRQDLLSSRRIHRREEWHSGPLGCCSEPMMCLKTLLFPCGTLSKIATAATNKHMTSADACNELLAYSLIASCCCYTCCIRMKLRNALNIRGGWCNDFLLHFCCCCCALVQELREIEIRGTHGPLKTKTSPPSCQYMES